MSYSLNSMGEVIQGITRQGSILGLIMGDTRSLDYSQYSPPNINYSALWSIRKYWEYPILGGGGGGRGSLILGGGDYIQEVFTPSCDTFFACKPNQYF